MGNLSSSLDCSYADEDDGDDDDDGDEPPCGVAADDAGADVSEDVGDDGVW